MYAQLARARAELSNRDATSVVLLDAAGDGFTVGNDLGDLVRANAGQRDGDRAALHREQLHQHSELFSLLRPMPSKRDEGEESVFDLVQVGARVGGAGRTRFRRETRMPSSIRTVRKASRL
jgi:hypothetical protein